MPVAERRPRTPDPDGRAAIARRAARTGTAPSATLGSSRSEAEPTSARTRTDPPDARVSIAGLAIEVPSAMPSPAIASANPSARRLAPRSATRPAIAAPTAAPTSTTAIAAVMLETDVPTSGAMRRGPRISSANVSPPAVNTPTPSGDRRHHAARPE